MGTLWTRPISASLSPNTEDDDVRLALKTVLAPWDWKQGKAQKSVRTWFADYLEAKTAVPFNSGRSALLALLWAFKVGKGDEVLVQAFTCVAVPNSVQWAGAKPVYVDVDDTLNIDPQNLDPKITPRTKALIVQHTFGVPARMDEIIAVAQKHKLWVIEDCAHSLGATYHGKKVGTLGDAAFFSFGRDKVVSSVFGGLAIVNPKHQTQGRTLKQIEARLPYPGNYWIFQQLLHPLAFCLILTSYNLWIGKICLLVLQKLRLLSRPVYPEEKRGLRPKIFPSKLPNALAILLLQQLAKLVRYNRNRRQVAAYYQRVCTEAHQAVMPFSQEGIYLRYPLMVPDPQKLRQSAKNKGVLFGNWYQHVIDPTGVDYRGVHYRPGSCPRAEEIARHIVNLPTRISLAQAARVVSLL